MSVSQILILNIGSFIGLIDSNENICEHPGSCVGFMKSLHQKVVKFMPIMAHSYALGIVASMATCWKICAYIGSVIICSHVL